MLKRLGNQLTHRIYEIPVLVLMPHSRCNCRCVMCDIWKGNQEKKEISVEELDKHLASFQKLGVQRVALSGGEALMHPNLWRFCERLRSIGVKISLLSTGLTIKGNVKNIVAYCDDVVISLDGTPELHDRIRNIPNAFEKLAEGVREIKAIDPEFRVTARTVIQKLNFRAFADIIHTAQRTGFDQISFLGADVSSDAFNRPVPWGEDRVSSVALDVSETSELEEIFQNALRDFKQAFENRFVAESPKKLMDIVRHYKGLLGVGEFPHKQCNAPWISAVVESNGDVMPCFFHKPYGNISQGHFEEIINSQTSIAFRKKLDVKRDPVCQRCVCSLHVGLRQKV